MVAKRLAVHLAKSVPSTVGRSLVFVVLEKFNKEPGNEERVCELAWPVHNNKKHSEI